VTRELGSEPLPAPVAAFIDAEFEAARATFTATDTVPPPDHKAQAEAFFLAALHRLAPPVA
jgi:hypothetical protein